MRTPSSPLRPRGPGFYVFRDNSSIPPPRTPTSLATPPGCAQPSVVHTILPQLGRRLTRSISSILLPVALLPFHLFFLFLSVVTTFLALLFFSVRTLQVYLEISVNTLSQIYTDYAVGGRKVGRRRRDLLRRVVLEREEAVRAEKLKTKTRGRGWTIA